MASRPAVKRITALGKITLAVAIVRTNSRGSKSCTSPKGVPLIFTSMLIGTLWGGSGKLASCWSKEILSSLDSPRPKIPPQQVFMPLFLTFAKVSNLS